jgi:hypothetical protein
MKRWRFIGTAALTIGTLAGAAFAAPPTKADMDLCNQKAAQVSKATPVKPGAGTTSPSPSSQPGSNPTGGRVTDSSQPGISPSQLGMAPIGDTDPAYRQAYLACVNERTK